MCKFGILCMCSLICGLYAIYDLFVLISFVGMECICFDDVFLYDGFLFEDKNMGLIYAFYVDLIGGCLIKLDCNVCFVM